MRKYWINAVVGLLGGPFLWWQMMRHHVGRSYSLQEHCMAVAAGVLALFLFVKILRDLGMDVSSFASYGSIGPSESWRLSGYCAAAILTAQLGVISFLPIVLATAAAVAIIGLAYATLAVCVGRGRRRRWLVAALLVGFALIAALAAEEMSHHGRKRPHQQSEAVRTDPVAGFKHARLQLPTGDENTC